MPTQTTLENGRLCNQIFRNICTSMIAKKHNLAVVYANHELIESIGIKLYSGTGDYIHTIMLTDDNFFQLLTMEGSLCKNIYPNNNYFQTKEISNYIYNYLQEEEQKSNVITMNPYRERYNTNNDCFIHIRLTDAAWCNPGADYYLKTLEQLKFDHLYIGSDEFSHPIISQICQKYPNTTLLHDYNEKDTILFGSTNKYVILSHGSFSAIIGYLSFYSSVYYPSYTYSKTIWYGDMFSIPGWHVIAD